MAKTPMHKKMYKDSPTMERDAESGKMKQGKKGPTEAEKESSEVNAGVGGMPQHVMHAHERQSMHTRHEMEHGAHDHHEKGGKEEMHARHEKEMKDMHKRHEKSHGDELHGDTAKEGMSKESKGSGEGKEKIEKVESGKE